MSIDLFNDTTGGLRPTQFAQPRNLKMLAAVGLFVVTLACPLVAQLSENEVEQLLFLKEEEKLARDVYATLGSQWNLRIFQNIARSEQVHMDQVDTLLVAYGLKDPVLDGIGRFRNPILQHLYDRLTTQGSLSIRTALGVGEFIEVIDIKDLAELIAATSQPSILGVAERLKSGSLNHLDAFRRQLDLLPEPFGAPDPNTHLINLSARGVLGEGDTALIGGFVIGGTDTMQVLLIVRGPSLAAFSVADPARDPALKLFKGDVRLATNDNWGDSASAELAAKAEELGIESTEAALLLDLPAGAYTFVTENRGSGSIGLIEIFSWSDPEHEARLLNLSVRGRTLSGEGRLIAGFAVRGAGSMPLAIRALGPTLSAYGITDVVEQPLLKIFREDEPVESVDDWIHTGVLGIVGSSYWPESILEPAAVVVQDSGNVTVHAIDQDGGSGIVLVDLTLLEP